MDQKSIARSLITAVGSFIEDSLVNREQRIQQKEQCAERLAAENGSSDKEAEVRYSDQAVLANLDWGIEALEEAINTSNEETKMARLDYAEKMLQVCAMLNSGHRTAGVPNFYLSAWAHLNLSYLWRLRDNAENSTLHVLEMFIVDPLFSRVDFAPELWKDLFLPHLSSIVGWYTESRHRLMLEVIPDSSDLSFSSDIDQFFNESLVFSMRPDQKEKLQKLEQLYGETLNENTRLFAKYFRDCINYDSTNVKKMIPMLPIAEPPTTPLHEVSGSIPDYVKFGPVLPKSAGFSRSKHRARDASRLSVSSTLSRELEESAVRNPEEPILEESEEGSESDSEPNEVYFDGERRSHNLVRHSSTRETEIEDIDLNIQLTRVKSLGKSPTTFSSRDSSRTSSPDISSPSLYVHIRKGQASLSQSWSSHVMDSPSNISLSVSPGMYTHYSISSPDIEDEVLGRRRSVSRNYDGRWITSSDIINSQAFENSPLSDDGAHSCISIPTSEKSTTRTRPPKDFVCPITSQLFNDPVTLETGQTYERKAIQEWLKRGNTTCPITRQPLSADSLPRTNFVLKRLVSSWKEQHPDLAQEFSYSETPTNPFSPSFMTEVSRVSTPWRTVDFSDYKNTDNYMHLRKKRFALAAVSSSPTSVITQAAIETIVSELKPQISLLSTSENLLECETAVLEIAKLWKESKGDPRVHSYLSKTATVNGFVEILSASVNRDVVRTAICILSELVFTDENIGDIMTSIDYDFNCLAALLKNGLAEAAVLIYLLRPGFSQLSDHCFIPSLVQRIQSKSEDLDDLQLIMEPKDAAILMLEHLLTGGDEKSRSVNAFNVIMLNAVPALVNCFGTVEEKKSIITILLCCLRADKSCRSLIASRIAISPVLDLFHSGTDNVRGTCIEFLSELVQLDRRTFCNNILQTIKEEGAFSTMHSFLVYLQMAPMEQQPAISTLLLQLDLLAEPRKMSIYREEAIETLIELLNRKDFPNSQKMALDALQSLSGRRTASGRSCMEAWLLKTAGLDKPYRALMKLELQKKHGDELTETKVAEEKAANSWEKRVAFVLCNHEKGSIFKAIEECFKSNSLEMAKSCLVVSTWLVYMLSVLPDTGVRDAARKSLLDEFINLLQSSKNMKEMLLATLALKTFVNDPAALEELAKYAKCIHRSLRKIKRNSVIATEVLKSLMNLPSVNAAELWKCNQVVEIESSANGEVASLLYVKGRILSGHSDGTVKVWDAGKRFLRLIQEVREHAKAVTCLYVSSTGDRLYSGSLDKTIRVWVIKPREINCLQVHDVKEAVHELVANPNVACFISQGTGVKVYDWSGSPKHLIINKNVKCLALTGSKLYCGCSGYSIQELDLSKFTATTFYSGTKKLLGKQSIHSIHAHEGTLFVGGSAVDGTAGQVFFHSTKAIVGSFSTGFDIIRIIANNDFIFTATKCGMIEVWLKERVSRIAFIKVINGGHAKITSLASDMDGGMLYAGSSDGKIQAWALD
ncbi:hypothetical protein K2173_007346 [Erythroxylum novogranatense]|uniref:RING-type E3 ubiquitin transferase n=1 Tax=Erythroxylum novogranatense TaxID=1862640 RepID=A0AAV8T5X8_9ROSI|nr:hypothetical protein K2173_007346 [Erythroxylum novogranatense]